MALCCLVREDYVVQILQGAGAWEKVVENPFEWIIMRRKSSYADGLPEKTIKVIVTVIRIIIVVKMIMMITFAGDIRAKPLGAGVVEEALGVGKTHYQVT